MSLVGCSEMFVRNYEYMLCNIAEECILCLIQLCYRRRSWIILRS